jgi:hypothetical protein
VLAALAVVRLTEETTLAAVAAERFLLETISHSRQAAQHIIPAELVAPELQPQIQPEQPEAIRG